jgi:hypothetical protein
MGEDFDNHRRIFDDRMRARLLALADWGRFHDAALKGIQAIVDQFAKTNPKVAGSTPGQFVNVHFLRELDASGYIDRLYTR